MNLRLGRPAAWTATFVSFVLAKPCTGQNTREAHGVPGVTTSFSSDASLSSDAAIELRLDRPLSPEEGELALVVGGVDVTAVSERSSSRIVYQPTAFALPFGEVQVVLYRRSGNRWSEIRRFAVTVRQAIGRSRFNTEQSASVGNKGQIAEGRSSGLPVPDRRTFQDFVLNGGMRSTQERGAWSFSTQSNYVGVTRRQEALRFGARGDRAPMLDLSDYLVSLRGPSAALSLGHVSFGTSRHLANGFAARGSTLSLTRGGTTLTAGALAGSSQVGWSDVIGLERPSNRVLGASIGQELFVRRPGVLRLDVTALDASKLPISAFTQAAVVDAEQSAGGTLQLSAALPNQRLRVTGGYTRSRFENPRLDAQLLGDSAVKRPRPETRGARFVEMNAVLLQNTKLLFAPASVTIGFRDERLDPLFRSVTAPVAADRQQDAVDATISFGALAGQLSHSWNRDNVGNVSSVLTTNGRGTTASLAIPVAAVTGIRTRATLLPVVTLALNRSHNFSDHLPTNGAFRPTDLPDQLSTNSDAAALWQMGRVRFSLRANQSLQDNRQELRERADFSSGVRVVSLGTTLGTFGDVGVDLGDEFQKAKERDETTRVRRLTVNGSLRPKPTTNVLAALSMLRNQPPVGASTLNSEQRVELSQGINLWTGASGAQRGQLFLRYARIASLLPDLSGLGISTPLRTRQQQWTLASGLNLRLF